MYKGWSALQHLAQHCIGGSHPFVKSQGGKLCMWRWVESVFFFAGLNIQARKSVNTYFKIDVNLYIYIL